LPLQYSAEILRSDGGKIAVYLDGAKRRVEQTVAGTTRTTIWRPDLGKCYGIECDTQTYTTHSITPEVEAVAAKDVEDDEEWEYVATEPFGSRTADVYDVYAIGTARRRARVYVDSETHIRWKEVTFNKLGKEVLTIETKNVVMGPPPATVFELPTGLREFHIPKHD
jgi:hypothetical protein